MRIVSVCGSTGRASTNRSALTHASEHIVAHGHVPDVVEAALDDVPVFDPRLADDPPDTVIELSTAFETADGVMLAAPEYAGGLAGGTKTALDWMVGLASLYHRPVVVLSAGTTGGEHAMINPSER